MKKRSVALTGEQLGKLEDIQLSYNCESISDAVRYCIEATYSRLLQQDDENRPPAAGTLWQETLEISKKNNILLNFLLIDLVKSHGGHAKDFNEDVLAYLERLRDQIKTVMITHGLEIDDRRNGSI